MSEEILFTKMHGIGNDYIYINCLTSTPRDLPQLAIEMSRRHFSVGADGIILICPSEVADFRMRVFNADGSEARMCGNGSRCVGKYVADHGLTDRDTITLETLGGIKKIELHRDATGCVDSATVDMGPACFSPGEIPVALPREILREPVETSAGVFELTAVSMGNPHAVAIVENPATLPIETAGPELEHHRLFPQRANIEFVAVDSPRQLTMRVWERGSGETMACGTGACAAAAVAMRLGLAESRVRVRLLGGDLEIERRDDGHMMMTGPATTAFEGRYRRKS